jgi:hypothetical protein
MGVESSAQQVELTPYLARNRASDCDPMPGGGLHPRASSARGKCPVEEPCSARKQQRLLESVLDLVEERRSNVAPADFLGHELDRYKPLVHRVQQIPDPQMTQRMAPRDPRFRPIRGIVLEQRAVGPSSTSRVPVRRQFGASLSRYCL